MHLKQESSCKYIVNSWKAITNQSVIVKQDALSSAAKCWKWIKTGVEYKKWEVGIKLEMMDWAAFPSYIINSK